MEKARKRKLLWFVLGIFSSVSAAVGTPLLAWFALEGWYIAVAFLIALVGHGFYGIPFYFAAHFRANIDIECIEAVGECDSIAVADISARTQITEPAVRRRIAKCLACGYLPGYTLEGDVIIKNHK